MHEQTKISLSLNCSEIHAAIIALREYSYFVEECKLDDLSQEIDYLNDFAPLSPTEVANLSSYLNRILSDASTKEAKQLP